MTTQTFIDLSGYGLKYYHIHTDGQGVRVRLRIYQRGFSGTATEIGGLRALSLEVQGGNDDATAPIVKTSLSVVLADFPEYTGREGRKYGLWSEFYTPDSTLYLVTVEREISGSFGALWAGYITPDSWSEGLDTDGDIAITVRDNIGHLSDFPFDLAGDGNGLVSVLEVLQGAMTKITFPMTLKYSTAAEGNAAALTDGSGTNIWAARVNVSQFEGDDWGHVLETVLGDLGLVLRYVGGSTYWAGPLRNLTLLGGTTTKAPSGDIALTFLGRNGVRQIDPAYKQIIEELAYETNSNLDLPVQGGLSGMPTAPDYDWSYQMTIANPPAPGYDHINVITHGWNRTNTRGWTSTTAAFGNPAHYQIPEDSDALKDMALLVTNNDIRASYILDTHSPALRVTMTLKNGTSGVNTVETLRDGSFFNYFRLAKVTYAVAMHSNYGAAGDTVRYWNGYEWKTAETQLEQEFDTEQIAERVLDFTLAECADIPDGGQLEIIIIRADCVSYWTVWGSTQYYIYVPVSVLAVSSSLGVVSGDRVTTINDAQYNVTLDRRPDIGALSRDFGRIDNHTYENVLYRIDGNGMPQPWGYNAQWSDQSAALPFPVQMHLSLLCWHFTGMEVLEGDCIRADNGPWDFGAILAYKGARFLLVSGTLDLASGRMRSAIFHAFVEYIDTWGTSPDVDYEVKEGAAGNTSGTMGGYSGGAAAGGGGAAGTQYFEPHNDGIILKSDYDYVSVPDVLLGEDEESLTSLLAIIAGKADHGETAYGYFSDGVLGTSHLPALYLGTTQIQTTSAAQAVTGVTNLTMSGKLTIGGAEIEWVPPADASTPGYLKINSALLTLGDQIVGSGTPGGGGGGAGYLYELGDIYHDTDKTKVLRTDGTTPAAVGDVLQLTSLTGGNKWAAVPATDIGRVYQGGTGITIDGDTISLSSGVATTGTYRSVTVDTYGRVTAGTNPTTLSGYGITDAVPSSRTVNSKALSSNITLTLDDVADGSTRKLANYLPLTGGTLERDGVDPLSLNNSGQNNACYEIFKVRGTNKVEVGYSATSGAYLYNYAAAKFLNITDAGALNFGSNTIWHSGNSNKSDVAWSASSLTLNGAISGATNITASGSISLSTTAASERYYTVSNSADTAYFGVNGSGNAYLWLAGAHKLAFYTNNTTQMTIDSSGNVGIGTASPGYKLDVNGAIRSSNAILTGSDIRFYSSASPAAFTTRELGVYSGYSYDLSYYDGSAWNRVYHSGNSNKDTIAWTCASLSANGMIKSTSVANVIGGTGVEIYYNTTSSIGVVQSYDRTNGVVKKLHLYGSNICIIPGSSSSVGINTESPDSTYSLDITGKAHTSSHIYMGGYLYMNFGGSWRSIIDNTGSAPIFGYAQTGAGALSIFCGYTVRICGGSSYSSTNGINITGSNDVGIGTASPEYKLHVAGDICTNTYLRINAWSGYGSGSAAFWYNGNTSTLALNKGLSVTGTITSTGDQVISSDERLKTIVKPVDMTVEQLAGMRAVIYDRKDSGVRSLGVIAQDWEKVLPESVNQGEYLTFKYAQTAMVSAIVLAKHETEQDKEIRKLREKVQKLEMDNLRLKARLGLEN